ncbi:ABC-type transport auxiliary lipoprotein family protein [Alkalilacustris brevis]|uniref:ABC-type transport auxiliary lipoprotein family protein n=1 Tax=Alkalilacustris brevis TaxID=2026338 RepID=UPI000E0D2A7A|nr:ABC-type transport auxiliary lipoprotein family protein [Alkalilacustris brevis]
MTPAPLPQAIIARRLLIAATLALSLAGCATIAAIGQATTPLDAYELRAPADVATARGGALARDLIIEVPTTSGALDSDRIMIRPNPLQAQYLPGARWAENLPVMMQTVMLRSLENTNALRYVGRRPLGGAGDFALVSEITDFQAELRDGDGAELRLRMTVRIIRESDASILASRTFTSGARSASTDTLDIVTSFDTAAQPMLREIAAWVLDRLGIPADPPAES